MRGVQMTGRLARLAGRDIRLEENALGRCVAQRPGGAANAAWLVEFHPVVFGRLLGVAVFFFVVVVVVVFVRVVVAGTQAVRLTATWREEVVDGAIE